MAQVEVKGLDGLIRDLDAVARDTPKLAASMLDAQADVVEPAMRRSLHSQHLVRSGALLRSVSRRKGRGKDGPSIRIGPRGEHHRYLPRTGSGIVSAGYVGYIAEYGIPSRGLKPRLWVRKTVQASENSAADAALRAYDQYLKKHNL